MKIELDVSDLKRELKKFLATKGVRVAAATVIENISRRTDASVDADKIPFKKYTPDYLQQRFKFGLGAQVDLKVTGKYRGSIFYDFRDNEIRVPFSQEGKAKGLAKKRLNIAANESDLADIETDVAKALEKEFS